MQKLAIAILCIIVIIVLGPVLTVWAVNTIAEQSGSDFYLHHNVWSYMAVVVLGGLLRGSAK